MSNENKSEQARRGRIELDQKIIAKTIGLGVIIGVGLVIDLLFAIWDLSLLCDCSALPKYFNLCAIPMMVKENPPWTVITALVTAPALILLWYWRTVHSRANLCNTQEQIVLDRERNTNDLKRQFNDRFLIAIDLLGKDNEDTQRGAIYALELLMRDAPSYQPTIIETLSDFIRRNAPYPPIDGKDKKDEEGHLENRSSNIRTDIQAALTVIGRRNVKFDRTNYVINLSHVCLEGYNFDNGMFNSATFYQSNLKNASLCKTNLINASLVRAKVNNAYLIAANLQNANLSVADLQEATLEGSDLEKAILSGANLYNASLTYTNFRGARLLRANLQEATLEGAQLQGSNLQEANLQEAFLVDASLQNANLSRADLQNADLGLANLQNANLNKVNLRDAILYGARFVGTRLGGADISNAQISEETLWSSAIYNTDTKFPDGFDPKTHQMINTAVSKVPFMSIEFKNQNQEGE
ncbi:MAG: pentapeptide repeat-containing protein [Candidatus Alcyoniella australis]|nr:pentapeptide repeat-containing protein [Candidatus Alcyoniella australis]